MFGTQFPQAPDCLLLCLIFLSLGLFSKTVHLKPVVNHHLSFVASVSFHLLNSPFVGRPSAS